MRFGALIMLCLFASAFCSDAATAVEKKVFIIPIRDEIATPLTYLVRRGVKQAIEAKADLLILDMDTNGGRLDSTEEILRSLSQFKGQTIQGQKKTTTRAGTNISFLAYWPGTILPGQVSNELVNFTDFLPTLADAPVARGNPSPGPVPA